MSDLLEKIEAKHQQSCDWCIGYAPDACSEVKLARTLECVLDSEGGCPGGLECDCPWCRGWRVLNEVAGGSDD